MADFELGREKLISSPKSCKIVLCIFRELVPAPKKLSAQYERILLTGMKYYWEFGTPTFWFKIDSNYD